MEGRDSQRDLVEEGMTMKRRKKEDEEEEVGAKGEKSKIAVERINSLLSLLMAGQGGEEKLNLVKSVGKIEEESY